MRPATIRDVAREAGVSLSTVSQVLNGHTGWASAETSERILAIARKLKYRPNHIARGLVLARTGTLGVVITSFGPPLFQRLIEGVDQSVRAAGYSVILAWAEDEARERAAFEMLSDKRVDGVIFMGNTVRAASTHLAWLASQGVPVVAINRPLGDDDDDDETAAFHHIAWDDEAVGRQATQHLLDLGHRRIAHLAGILSDPPRLSAVGRLNGYMACVAEPLVIECGYTYEQAFAATLGLLDRADRPTAIFAASDSMAIGAINALVRARVWVPDEVSVIGVNDDLHARLTEPPLTTVAIPIMEAGRRAVEIITAASGRSSPLPVVRETLPAHLVLRASTAPPHR